MNTPTALIGGVIIIVVIGGAIFFLTQNPNPSAPGATTTPATSTDSGSDNGGSPATPVQASAPTVVTHANVAPSNSTAVVTGTVDPNGAPTTYWYEYGESTSLGGRTASQSIGSGFSPIPAPGYITGLRANTQYYFRLSAQNRLGTVNGATQSFSTNNNPPPQGSAPSVTTNAATDVTRTSANVHGRVDPNNAQTSYWFEYGTNADMGNTTSLQSAGSGTSAVSAQSALTGLAPLTKYFYRINAQNQFGTVVGSTQSFTTAGPANPAAPSATTRSAIDIGTTTATLRGTIDPNGAETTYWFEYSTDSLLGSLLLKTTPQKSAGAGTSNVQVEADVSGLNPDTTYHFRAVAQNSQGTDRGDRETFKTK